MAAAKAQNHNIFGPLRPRIYRTVSNRKDIRTPISASTPTLSATAGTDAALAALQQQIASETLKKQEHTIVFIKDGVGLPVPGKKGAKATKSRFPQQGRSLNSHPSSPALSGVGSPSLAPTSVPLSQKQAELAKAARKPVIHLLASQPWTEIALREEVSQFSKNELKEALEKVGDLNESIGKWELRRAFYKELDVWNFDYPSEKDRQRAIDNAVKTFDKQRLAISEPQWERLLPLHERGIGKCLSKLQAQIAIGPIPRAPKINVTKANDSGRDTPGGEDDESMSDKNTSKPKKISAGEAQARRLLSKKPLKPAAKPTSVKPTSAKPAPSKKAATSAPKVSSKASSKVLSSEYVQDSGSEDEQYKAPVKPLNKPAQKRSRDEEVDTSDSSIPLSKKPKKETAPPHRVSDASQTSRTTNSSTYSSTGSSKNKSNSPQKSSPLASSPPTNASDFYDQSSGERTSSSASPPRISTKNSRSPIHKRHGKSSSVSSSTSSSSSRYLRPEVTDIARKYRLYYPKYAELHQELSTMKGKRDKVKEQSLLEMHARLEQMKKDILAGIVDVDSS